MCPNTEPTKARINKHLYEQREIHVSQRRVHVTSWRWGTHFHHWTRQGLLSMLGVLAVFSFTLCHSNWFSLGMLHTLLPVFLDTVFTGTASDREIRKTDHEHDTLLDLLPATHSQAGQLLIQVWGNHPEVEKPPGKPGFPLSELLCGWTIDQVLRAVSGHFSELIFPRPVVPFHRPYSCQVNNIVPQIFKAYKHHLCYQQGSISSCNNIVFQST